MNHSTTQPRTSHSADNMQAGATLLSAVTITGDEVRNMKNEKLGTIQDVMIDKKEGKIHYAVLVSGGFLGMGNRLYAIPWKALKQDRENSRFVLDVDIESLKDAPGFDKDQWPGIADATWHSAAKSYY